jgi:hypothetical protein
MPLEMLTTHAPVKKLFKIKFKVFNKLKLNSKKPYLDCPQTPPIWVTLV